MSFKFFSNKHKVLVCATPRGGLNSIEGNIVYPLLKEEHNITIKEGLNSVNYIMIKFSTEKNNGPKWFDENSLRIKFVRNPYHRAVSAYKWYNENAPRLYKKPILTFREFLETRDFSKDPNMHYRPQFEDGFDERCHIYKIETDILHVIDLINKRTGLNIEKKEKKLHSVKRVESDVKAFDDKLAASKPYSYGQYYNDELIQLCQDVYKKDMRYGYNGP